MKRISVYLFAVSFLVSCAYHSEDDLIDSNPAPLNVTYVDDVKVIIDNNCLSCHSDPPVNGAPMPLTTYDDVREAVLNRDLIDRIESQDPGFLMPLGGPRLPQNLIDLVIQWEADGLIEQ